MFRAEIWKISEFLTENFHCFGGKIFSIFEKACFRNVCKNSRNLGPSFPKLNKLISSQNVKCSNKYNIKFTGIFPEKMWVAFANAKIFFFSKNISIYAIFNDQSFNDTLTNDIVSFEQLGPDHCAHLHSPIKSFSVHLCILQYAVILLENWIPWSVCEPMHAIQRFCCLRIPWRPIFADNCTRPVFCCFYKAKQTNKNVCVLDNPTLPNFF